MPNTMVFTTTDLRDLKIAYKKAIEIDQEVFVFKGREFLVSYAKYLIEYLESKLR